jgi:integrase
VAVALSAGCDGSDPGEATRTAAQERVDAPATARLEAQAAQTERWAHLQGQARTYGAPVERPDDVRPNPIEAGNGAVAEHARALLAAVQDHRLGAAVALLFLQGWRVSEMLGLAWEDLDLESGTAQVRRASVYVDGWRSAARAAQDRGSSGRAPTDAHRREAADQAL